MKWKFTDTKSWHHLEETYDWVAAMHHVPQDPIHHTEGNVAIHTAMVLDALQALPAYAALDDLQREIVWTAALLHDVEKRSTTVVDSGGRITSHGHAKHGEYTARQVLFQEAPAPFAVREQIAALVRYHGLPLWMLEKRDPAKAAIEASLRVDMKLLAMLAKADALGRTCADQAELLDRVALFEAFCEEQECWHTPRIFASDLARFVYFHRDGVFPGYEPFDDLKGEVIMLSGLPGMGKDAYIKKYYSHLPMVSLDDIRRRNKYKPDDATATGWAVQEAKEQARLYLRKGQSFVWNATNITRQMRAHWIDLFASYKARVKVVYIETNYREWLRQNNNREHPVPHAAIVRMLQKLEVPTPAEAHGVEYVV